MKPCPICESKDVAQKDCGYSSFDPTWYECPNCGLQIGICFTSKCHIKADNWLAGWKKVTAILALTRQQAKELGLEAEYISLMRLRKAAEKKAK